MAKVTLKLKPKPWYESRTVWLGAVAIIAAGLEVILTGGSAQDAILAVFGVASILIRTVTTQPLGR